MINDKNFNQLIKNLNKVKFIFKKINIFKYLNIFLTHFLLGGCLFVPKKTPSLSSYCRTFRPYTINNKTYYPLRTYDYQGKGVASYYHPRFNGRRTACGEIFSNEKLTAAHKTLPMHSIVRITNLDNGRSIVVRINDRGPFSKKRLIDVSAATARALGFLHKGLTNVSIEVLKKESQNEGQKRGLYFQKK